MSIVDPLVLAGLALGDMLLLMDFRRRQARRYRDLRMHTALTMAIRQANRGETDDDEPQVNRHATVVEFPRGGPAPQAF